MSSENKQHLEPPLVTSRVGRLHLMIRKECDRVFREKDFPLEMDQIPVLAILYYQQGLSQQEICSKLHRDKASVNRTVTLLAKKGLAKVVQDKEDKRKTRVELNAAGKKLAKEADEVVSEMDAVMTSRLTKEELKVFSSLIDKLIY